MIDENIQEVFDHYVEVGDWGKALALGIELQLHGDRETEKLLWETVNEEDMARYKEWDLLTNGSTETQTDDHE